MAPVAAAVDSLQDLLDQTASDPTADPAERVANLRALRSDLAALVGIADRYIGDQELRRESGALDRVRQYLGARADANARGALLDGGAAPEALDAAGVLSHDELDRRLEDGSIEEAIIGLPDDELELREWTVAALAARQRAHPDWKWGKRVSAPEAQTPAPGFQAKTRELDTRVADAVSRVDAGKIGYLHTDNPREQKGLRAAKGAASPGTAVRDTGPVPDAAAPLNAAGKVSQKRLLAAAKGALSQPSTVDAYAHTDPMTGKRVYDESRRALHQKIIEKMLKGGKSQKSPKVLFLGGGYASGKGTMRRRLEAEGKLPEGAVTLDPDAIKAELPEFQHMSKEGDPEANLATYEEAWDIAQAVQKEAQKRKLNMVVDGLGNTSAEDMLGRVKSFKDAGYGHAEAHYVNAPTDEASGRAQKRATSASDPADRRVIPTALLRATHRDVSAALPGIIDGSREPGQGLDALHVHDTSDATKGEPKPLYSLVNGKETVHDEAGMQAALDKAKEHVAGVDAPDWEQGGTHDLGHIFTPEEGAQGKSPQPVSSVDDLYEQATAAHSQFADVLRGVGKALGGEVHDSQKDWENDVEARPGVPHVAIAPLKGRARAEEKIAGKYKGDPSQLADVVRGTITVPHVSNLSDAVDAVRSQLPKGWSIAAPENRFAPLDYGGVNTGPTPAGYRDMAMLLRNPEGFQSELQINTSPMLAAKSGEGHKLYERTRVLEEGAAAENRTPTSAEQDVIEASHRRAQEVYNDAHAKSSGPLPVASTAQHAPKPAAGADDGGWKQYLNAAPGAEVMPVSSLTPASQDSEEHIAKAGAFMDKTAAGEMEKRKPLTGRREKDGSVTILDGKSTLEQLKRRGVSHVPVSVSAAEKG